MKQHDMGASFETKTWHRLSEFEEYLSLAENRFSNEILQINLETVRDELEALCELLVHSADSPFRDERTSINPEAYSGAEEALLKVAGKERDGDEFDFRDVYIKSLNSSASELHDHCVALKSALRDIAPTLTSRVSV